MPWFLLFFAGLLEVAWVVGLKYSDGFTRLVPSLLTLGSMALSLWLLALAVRSLPLGVAYPIWVGIGAFGSALLGSLLFHETANPLRGLFLILLLVAIAGLKWTSG